MADAAVDLDGFFGLHPRLAPLKPLWDARQLAIVHACGSPDATRSHFDAQDYMETRTPGVKSTQDGWLNRYLHAQRAPGGDAVPRRRARAAAAARAAGHGAGAGDRPDRAVRHPRRPGDRHGAVVVRGASTRRPPISVLHATGREAFDAIKMLKTADPAQYHARQRRRVPAHRRSAQALQQIAQLVKADVGLEVAFAESGSWDHHVNEGAAHGSARQPPRRLRARHRRARHATSAIAWQDVVVLTMSEFGRAVARTATAAPITATATR